MPQEQEQIRPQRKGGGAGDDGSDADNDTQHRQRGPHAISAEHPKCHRYGHHEKAHARGPKTITRPHFTVRSCIVSADAVLGHEGWDALNCLLDTLRAVVAGPED